MTTEEIARALYLSLRAYPCRCAYVRQNQMALWNEGQRILEITCSRCLAIQHYEDSIKPSP